MGWIDRESGEEPEERPGGPGDLEMAKGGPLSSFTLPLSSWPSFWLFLWLPVNPIALLYVKVRNLPHTPQLMPLWDQKSFSFGSRQGSYGACLTVLPKETVPGCRAILFNPREGSDQLSSGFAVVVP